MVQRSARARSAPALRSLLGVWLSACPVRVVGFPMMTRRGGWPSSPKNLLDTGNRPSRLREGTSETSCGYVGVWLSLVERCVRDAEVGGSNPLTPTPPRGLEAMLFLALLRPNSSSPDPLADTLESGGRARLDFAPPTPWHPNASGTQASTEPGGAARRSPARHRANLPIAAGRGSTSTRR